MPDMTSFMFERFGKHPLSQQQRPIPTPNADEVQIQIMAAGVNPVDIKKRNGELRFLLPEATSRTGWPRLCWHHHSNRQRRFDFRQRPARLWQTR